MSVQSLSWGLGFTIGPVLGGFFFHTGHPYVLWGVLFLLMLVTMGGLTRLGRTLPLEVNQPSAVTEEVNDDDEGD
jgi:MFS family permease